MGNCRKFKCSVTLTLTLDRVKVTPSYTIRVGLPACPTMWLYVTQYRNTAIWISWNMDIRRSLNSLVIAFLEGNSKIGLRQAVVQVPYYHKQPSVLSCTQNGGEDRARKVQFSKLRKLRDLDLDLRSGRGNTGAHCAYVVEVYPHTKLGRNRKKNLWTYGRRDTPEFQSTRSSVDDDLKLVTASRCIVYLHGGPKVRPASLFLWFQC